MKIVSKICAAVVISAATSTAQAQDYWSADAVQTANGTYRSNAPEPWFGGYGTREYVFANGQWQVIFTHALDPDMTLRTFIFRTGGTYEIEGPNAAIEGAYNGIFYQEWKHLTRLTDNQEIVAALGFSECGLPHNLETDISDTGCAAWVPVSVCAEEHDILFMTDGGLQFGVRPADNDMCTADKRPTELLPEVARFQ